MDSGPVATFQVHEYLRPKVRFLSLDSLTWKFSLLSRVHSNYYIFLNLPSCVIYMKTIPSLINSSVVRVVMDCELQQAPTGLVLTCPYIWWLYYCYWHHLSMCHNMLFLFMSKAICSECLVVPREVLRHQL
jgi:hypothetical protein